jgi:uncharacterized protein YjiK
MIMRISAFLFSCCLMWTAVQAQSLDYNLDAPELVGEMPKALDEISGLTLAPGTNKELLAVEDERGKFYRLDVATGSILAATDFWKDGDYEGIEVVGEEVWVVKNTGTLYQIRQPESPDQSVEKFNTALNDENDVEGLTYDPHNHRLLLACKRDAKDDGNPKTARYLFAFDLNTKKLSEGPVYAIEREAVQNFLASSDLTPGHKKLSTLFNDRDKFDLAPSAVAIHPITHQLFITSSVGKVLMVLNRDGRIEHLEKLDKQLFPQPEGLAFDPDGTLYISTERKKDQSARIYRLPYLAGK